MFGIKRNSSVMCYSGNDKFQFCGEDRIRRPVMVSSAIEVDNLCQKCMVAFNLYDLMVFEFTREEEEEFLIKRLKGH